MGADGGSCLRSCASSVSRSFAVVGCQICLPVLCGASVETPSVERFPDHVLETPVASRRRGGVQFVFSHLSLLFSLLLHWVNC